MPARVAGICGLLAFVTVNIGWIAGGLAQPAAYSVANDDISDLGADTANSSWIYDQIGANLTGLLVITLALGLWRALSPDVLGRIGAGAMLVAGAGAVLDGFFHLDCRGIDAGCTNDSWHSHAHKIESGHHRRRDHRRAADPRVRVPAHPRMAGRVAAEPAHGARDRPGQRRLLGGWERGGHTSGNDGCRSSGSPSSACVCFRTETAPRQPERPAGRRRVARGYECRLGQVFDRSLFRPVSRRRRVA